MHHSGCFYGFWYKGCSYKNKLCLSEPFSPPRFVRALITDVGGYRSSTEKPDLQLQIAGLNHCYDGTASEAGSGERSASSFTESRRDVSVSCEGSGDPLHSFICLFSALGRAQRHGGLCPQLPWALQGASTGNT